MAQRILVMLFISLISISSIFSQTKGTITYEQTVFVHKNLSPEQQAYKALLPETITKKINLYYNESNASLQIIKEKQAKGIQIQMGSGSDNSWFDLKNKLVRNYFKVDGEVFYTENKIENLALHPTGKSKMILGHECKEYINDDMHLWLCTDLPNNLTPLPPFYLPGCILAIENDKIAYQAVHISKELDKNSLIPREGTKVTEEQAADLKEEMLNELKSKTK